MSVTVENLEHNMAKLTIEVPAEELETSIQRVYQRQKCFKLPYHSLHDF